jgi:hypothetical protein
MAVILLIATGGGLPLNWHFNLRGFAEAAGALPRRHPLASTGEQREAWPCAGAELLDSGRGARLVRVRRRARPAHRRGAVTGARCRRVSTRRRCRAAPCGCCATRRRRRGRREVALRAPGPAPSRRPPWSSLLVARMARGSREPPAAGGVLRPLPGAARRGRLRRIECPPLEPARLYLVCTRDCDDVDRPVRGLGATP